MVATLTDASRPLAGSVEERDWQRAYNNIVEETTDMLVQDAAGAVYKIERLG